MTIDHIRKQRKHEPAVPLEPKHWNMTDTANFRGNPEFMVERSIIEQQIREACRYLTDSQNHLLEMLYWKGYTLSEIAHMNDEPLGTVKSRLHQTLKILRKQLYVIREDRY